MAAGVSWVEHSHGSKDYEGDVEEEIKEEKEEDVSCANGMDEFNWDYMDYVWQEEEDLDYHLGDMREDLK